VRLAALASFSLLGVEFRLLQGGPSLGPPLSFLGEDRRHFELFRFKLFRFELFRNACACAFE
jgi:hypothetical protein